MIGQDSLIADNHINDLTGNMLKFPTTFPVGNRIFSMQSMKNSKVVDLNEIEKAVGVKSEININEYMGKKNEFVMDTKGLNPLLLEKMDEHSDQKHAMIALVRDYDTLACKLFIFMDDVCGLGEGVGLHIHFPKILVIPFVVYLLPAYIYFLASVEYGFIAWLITVLLPFMFALSGTFSQFWDIFIYCNLIGWGSIYLVYTLPGITNTYIYSAEVWNNTDFNNTVCFGTCDSLDESSDYFGLCIISFVISSISFIYVLISSLAPYCTESKFMTASKRLNIAMNSLRGR